MYLNTSNTESNAGYRLVPFLVELADLGTAAGIRGVDRAVVAGEGREDALLDATGLGQRELAVVDSASVTAAFELEY